jgi:alpha-tubulin suppressor-like RCC1 family protein
MRASLIAVVAIGCKFSEPTVGGDAGVDSRDGPGGMCAAMEIAAGGDHACARLSDGTMTCWGANDRGQIGVAAQTTCTTSCNPTPVQVPLSTVTSLGLGDDHTCAVTANGVYCWGANQDGEFGDGGTNDSATPELIGNRAGTEVLVAGDSHTCSLRVGSVLCSGNNGFGELGIGNNNPSTVPVAATLSGITVAKLGTGFNHVLAISDTQMLYGWGHNASIQLDNTAGDKLSPMMLAIPEHVLQVVGGVLHTCALLDNHTLKCRGSNASGQLAQATTGTFGFVPLPGITGVDMISAGGQHTCMLSAGAVRCFGLHFTNNPVLITLPHPATAIASGSSHACALLDDHSVWCWGDNSQGQLGDGTTTMSQTTGVNAVCR